MYSISYNDFSLADIELRNMVGDTSATFPRLLVQFRCHVRPPRAEGDNKVTWFVRDVRGHLRASVHENWLLGNLVTTDTSVPFMITTSDRSELTITLACDLDPGRLAVAERCRAKHPERDFPYSFKLIFFIDGPYGPRAHSCDIVGHFPQSEWLKVLKAMGKGRYLSVEIPMPSLPEEEKWKEAMQRLQQARHNFDDGHYDTSVSCSRSALDLAANAMGEPEFVGQAWDKALGGVDHADKREALKQLFQGLRALGNLGPHPVKGKKASFDPNKLPVSFSRDEAEFVLQQTAVTLAFIGNVLASPERA
ncbi:MAG: hypothetical protein HY849_01835 [Nitrosomonadales bacterium]|nr:hypothetical protein [Nitrosomonadales bacterium]